MRKTTTGSETARTKEGPVTEAPYDRAARALQLALERANLAADRLTRQWAAGVVPSEEDVAGYRRLSAALTYAEAVWQVEAELLVATGTEQLRHHGTGPRTSHH
ncbi:hypothetical protein KVF89_18720 [Nocardioides carbamazepini]|uniref:hypothetical protein n=1 Tax=Nocardioides carbamazepini TaxID=2854259 RepID=UPI00214A2270|nr:hypothetical protein [Nocardioides carbamazepini]MCR1784584.1 hypothetical protein [Nocardioides carbamazepini]